MRLLECQPDGGIILHEFIGRPVPTYAILSHTWGEEEVSFQEADAGTRGKKSGWKKIDFCAKQAGADGLRYFWVDTCCIDKRNAVELSEAINSMFRWYRNAARCYVYLSDVSINRQQGQSNSAWEVTFKQSRWFTRGWTLQELIAPALVDFFGSNGERLGSKVTLEHIVHKRTGIPTRALRGCALSNFAIDELISWAEYRNTTLEEDKFYCLLGIFNVTMPLIYGEGGDRASQRLRAEIHKSYKGTGPNFERFTVGLNIFAFPEAAQFVARQSELTEMNRLLHGHATRSSVVLYGLGGIGKTQLAIEYIRQNKEKYTAIFWLNAHSEDTLRLSFKGIAQEILKHYPSNRMLASGDLEGNLDQVANVVKSWLDLRKNTCWLMIYDNYDNPRSPNNSDPSAVDIRGYLPRADHGSVIIMTRSANVTLGRRLHIQKLSSEDGLKIISNVSGRRDIEDDPDAIRLAIKLDGLPLALSTAGAYLEPVITSFLEYLQLYEESWLKLQITSPILNSYEDRSLYTTWTVTFDRIQRQNTVSARLLELWAYFDYRDLWFGILRHGNSTDDELIQKLTEDELNFNEAIRLLLEYGLVYTDHSLQRLSRPEGYNVHSCVHSWSSSVLNRQWNKSLGRLALTCVASEVPSTYVDKWCLLQRRLLLHAGRYERLLIDGKIDVKGIEWALHKLGDLYKDQGKLAGAEKMYLRALQGKEEALGLDHISTLSTVNSLGILYSIQGKLAGAEKMYLRALQGKEEALGLDHRSTLSTVNSLGVLYSIQGKLAEAEKMYLRALQGRKEAVESDNTLTLSTVYNLGILYKDQGKLAEAEKMFDRALKGFEKALGPDHTSTLLTIHILGVLYKDQGKLVEAEKMFDRALEGYIEALGPDHSSILIMIHNLGNLYSKQGKLAKAENMYIQALQGYEETFGLEHISIPSIVYNLGNLYFKQGKLAEAENMFDRALQGFVDALSVDLASSYLPALKTMVAFGDLLSKTDRKDMAKAMYDRALSGYRTVHGPSSQSCSVIEGCLQALQFTPPETQHQALKPRGTLEASMDGHMPQSLLAKSGFCLKRLPYLDSVMSLCASLIRAVRDWLQVDS